MLVLCTEQACPEVLVIVKSGWGAVGMGRRRHGAAGSGPYPVTAPCDAEPTSRAYLLNTPLV